ncbi:hypothetical protein CASFOL_031763 [Castilleja foliolosa]|uniref:Eukaryotic translation initiation factor 3 30 kDa subunit n=1 Tax=Castilleja foliolosa TaxID=1961234 RepID=A0ABD3C5M3_9LAMI
MEDFLVEESDYKPTAELCGKMGDEKTLDNFIPKSESDFTEYAELIAHKLRPYEKSYHYIGLLKAVMRLSTVSLKGSDAKDVFSCLNDDMIIRPYEDEPVTSFLKKDNEKKVPLDLAEDLDDRSIRPYKAVGNTNSNQLRKKRTKIDWNRWPVERVWVSEKEIGPNDEDVEDMNSYQDNNLELFDRDPRVWLEEQEQVWMKYFKGCK